MAEARSTAGTTPSPEGSDSRGPGAVHPLPWLGAFGGAGVIWLATHVSLWAYDRGLLGPRHPGNRLLLGGPLVAVRAVHGMALAVAAYSGIVLLTDLRGRWRGYTERVRREALRAP